MISIVASIPGRLRVRGDELRAPGSLQRLQHHLWELDDVIDVRVNSKAGSAVVRYDHQAAAGRSLELEILKVAEQVLGVSYAAPSPVKSAQRGKRGAGGSRKSRPARMVANRHAKQVMLGSLVVVLATGLFRYPGWRYWHTVTGWAFFAALAVHMYVYRRHLLR
ncbi:DUF4405 domain-containing protein [Halorhodospira halochloris]|uniref:Copper chaperone n=1 Tax=Halorhodospira halochloris TaxID=1052 RepID=A0A0X8XAT4_HALHR|nr:DUF4405 domain-containing protein [Halorhodospira halochloris]MBK1652102.1 hypothetical protein [Halorhodospira halochloris]MCG5530783.1 DUF4405 domain-containing protein [Halorhodospira halochloris]BAU58023.1 copper chaperone [Halorhodospira halochloris]